MGVALDGKRTEYGQSARRIAGNPKKNQGCRCDLQVL
jgi:hypothetical protein